MTDISKFLFNILKCYKINCTAFLLCWRFYIRKIVCKIMTISFFANKYFRTVSKSILLTIVCYATHFRAFVLKNEKKLCPHAVERVAHSIQMSKVWILNGSIVQTIAWENHTQTIAWENRVRVGVCFVLKFSCLFKPVKMILIFIKGQLMYRSRMERNIKLSFTLMFKSCTYMHLKEQTKQNRMNFRLQIYLCQS